MSSDEDEDWFEQAVNEPDTEDADESETADADTDTEEPADAPDSAFDTSTEDDDPFNVDFATAFENAPSPSGEEGVPEDIDALAEASDSFEDEEFESDLPVIDIGIEGLDNMIQGGVPERSLMVAMGDAGTGKTTFGLQFINHALKHDEHAVFITLEESYDRVINSAEEKGWPFSDYVDNEQLAILDLDPVEMANSLTSIRSELPALIQDFGASRLVLDSVSLLEMMFDSQATRRTEIYDFTRSLKEAGVTTMLTSEAAERNPYSSRFGIIEYLTDAVFVLRYIREEDFRETRLAIEIQKIRDANHSREMKPFEITSEGISVYRQASIF